MKKSIQIGNIVGLLFALTLNYLANALPIAGKTTGELSDMYPNLFVPAGLTFSIWGLIYLLLIGFVIVQSRGLFSKLQQTPEWIPKVGWLFAINGFLNGIWILFWHHQYVLISLFIMLGLLVTLLLLYRNLVINHVPNSGVERYLVQLPFRIYLGWILIATIANVTTWLVDIDWNGFGIPEESWAIVVIGLGLLANLLFALRYRDPFLPLVGVWAFYGIYLKRTTSLPVEQTVATAAMVAGIILLLAASYAFFQPEKVRQE